jgi:hypothetical protein
MLAHVGQALPRGRWIRLQTAARSFRLAGPLAAVMIATAVYCVSRLAVAWRWRRPAENDVDAAHVLMGVAMAGMLVPRLNPFGDAGWEVVFGVAAAWFGARAVRQYLGQRTGGRQAGQHVHHVHHLLASGAMLYMLACAAARAGVPLAAPGMAGMAGAPAAGFPSLTLGLALVLFVGVIWAADGVLASSATATVQATAAVPAAVAVAGNAAKPGRNLATPARNPVARVRPAMSPRLAACCEIVMGMTMSYMLITML